MDVPVVPKGQARFVLMQDSDASTKLELIKTKQQLHSAQGQIVNAEDITSENSAMRELVRVCTT